MRWGKVLGVISEVQEARRDDVITLPELIEIGQAVCEAMEIEFDLGFSPDTIDMIRDQLDQRSPIHDLTTRLMAARDRFDDVELDSEIDSGVGSVIGGFLERQQAASNETARVAIEENFEQPAYKQDATEDDDSGAGYVGPEDEGSGQPA